MTTGSVTAKLAAWIDRASGYLLGIATTCTATGLRYAIQPELGDRSRTMLFVPAVLITAWYGGVGPGVFALGLGAILWLSILVPPVEGASLADHNELVALAVYLSVGAAVIALVHRERREKARREAAQAKLEQLNALLEQLVRERTSELEFSNRELESFCYSVSHDLRTPTRAIVGNIHILVDEMGDGLDDLARQKLSRISLAALKLSNLVDALLTYARLAKEGLTMESVDLKELISAEARSCAQAHNARIRLDLPDELVVTGDKGLLHAAVHALVSNAVTYSRQGEEVHLAVTIDRNDSDAVLCFRDDGIGFDEQYLPKIFQPFERLHRDEEYPGVGMGLANVARIAERHHGAAWAESKLGEGSAFYLRLGDQRPVSRRDRQLVGA